VLLSQPHNIRLAAKRGKRSSFSLFLESLTLCDEREERLSRRLSTLSRTGLSDFVPEGLARQFIAWYRAKTVTVPS
jgi:hypothetical protein